MISKKEIKKLGELARIEIEENELEKIRKDLANVLDFVSKLKNAPVSEIKETDIQIFNVFREDRDARKEGECSKDLLEQAPDIERGFIKVKKIFNG